MPVSEVNPSEPKNKAVCEAPKPPESDRIPFNGAPKGLASPNTRVIDGESIIPDLVENIVSGKTGRRQIKADLSEPDKTRLSKVLSMDFDLFRERLGAEVGLAAEEIAALLRAKAHLIKPDALAYSLAVATDKAIALQGRSALSQAAINIQVNNTGPTPRETLIINLTGNGAAIGLSGVTSGFSGDGFKSPNMVSEFKPLSKTA